MRALAEATGFGWYSDRDNLVPGRSEAVNSIHLTAPDRKAILVLYRRTADPGVRLRAHILLLLDAGHTWAMTSAVLYCSVSTISRWKRRFEAEGLAAIHGRPKRPRWWAHAWAAAVVRWGRRPGAVGSGLSHAQSEANSSTDYQAASDMSIA